MDTPPHLPAAVRARAERRLVAELRRLQRRQPLRHGVREDALVTAVLAAPDRQPAGHRGSGGVGLPPAALRALIEAMVADGRIGRHGHRLSLTGEESGVEPEMAARIARLLDQVDAGGANPPRVARLAAELGVPPGVIDQLRATGRLCRLGPGIDMSARVLEQVNRRLERMGGAADPTVAAVRDALGTSRRVATAILAARRRESGRAAQALERELGDG